MLAKKLRAVGGGSSALEFSLVHTANVNLTNQTHTYLSCSLGDADADREIWVTVSINFGGAANYSPTCTIGGVSAAQVLEWPSTSDGKGVAIFRLNVPSGTSADIVLDTASANDFSQTSIAVYRLVGYVTTPDDTWTSSTYTDDVSLTAAANDSAILHVIVSSANNATFSYSGLTTDYNPTPNTGNTWTHYSATGISSGAGTYTQSGGGTGTFHGAAVVIQPA